ncbi:MAG: hypothetical protein L3J79_05860 [Candidatus Marinimicrobia bacterium]|nr:hypothetical protein [Candidatus Neomarinimicrobiota bacterium]
MNYLKILLVAGCLLFGPRPASVSLFGAFEFQGVGWAAAAANIRVVGDGHPDRLLVNSALLGAHAVPRTGFQYSRPFSGLDLQAGSAVAEYQIGRFPVISALSYFGDDQYSELMVTLGTALSLSERWRTGLSLNLFQLNIAKYKARGALSISTSMSLDLTQDLRIGSILQHVMQVGSALTLPQRFHMGVAYDGGSVVLLVAVEKEAALPLEFCLALQTSSQRKWQLALGYRDLSQSLSAGWRLRYRNMGLHYSAVLHPDLPISHGFGLELFFQ